MCHRFLCCKLHPQSTFIKLRYDFSRSICIHLTCTWEKKWYNILLFQTEVGQLFTIHLCSFFFKLFHLAFFLSVYLALLQSCGKYYIVRNGDTKVWCHSKMGCLRLIGWMSMSLWIDTKACRFSSSQNVNKPNEMILTLKSGSLRRFIQVEAVGSLSCSTPAFWIQKGGSRSWEIILCMKKMRQINITLNPNNGGLEQLVTNFSKDLFCSSSKPETTCQKAVIVGWFISYPPE